MTTSYLFNSQKLDYRTIATEGRSYRIWRTLQDVTKKLERTFKAHFENDFSLDIELLNKLWDAWNSFTNECESCVRDGDIHGFRCLSGIAKGSLLKISNSSLAVLRRVNQKMDETLVMRVLSAIIQCASLFSNLDLVDRTTQAFQLNATENNEETSSAADFNFERGSLPTGQLGPPAELAVFLLQCGEIMLKLRDQIDDSVKPALTRIFTAQLAGELSHGGQWRRWCEAVSSHPDLREEHCSPCLSLLAMYDYLRSEDKKEKEWDETIQRIISNTLTCDLELFNSVLPELDLILGGEESENKERKKKIDEKSATSCTFLTELFRNAEQKENRGIFKKISYQRIYMAISACLILHYKEESESTSFNNSESRPKRPRVDVAKTEEKGDRVLSSVNAICLWLEVSYHFSMDLLAHSLMLCVSEDSLLIFPTASIEDLFHRKINHILDQCVIQEMKKTELRVLETLEHTDPVVLKAGLCIGQLHATAFFKDRTGSREKLGKDAPFTMLMQHSILCPINQFDDFRALWETFISRVCYLHYEKRFFRSFYKACCAQPHEKLLNAFHILEQLLLIFFRNANSSSQSLTTFLEDVWPPDSNLIYDAEALTPVLSASASTDLKCDSNSSAAVFSCLVCNAVSDLALGLESYQWSDPPLWLALVKDKFEDTLISCLQHTTVNLEFESIFCDICKTNTENVNHIQSRLNFCFRTLYGMNRLRCLTLRFSQEHSNVDTSAPFNIRVHERFLQLFVPDIRVAEQVGGLSDFSKLLLKKCGTAIFKKWGTCAAPWWWLCSLTLDYRLLRAYNVDHTDAPVVCQFLQQLVQFLREKVTVCKEGRCRAIQELCDLLKSLDEIIFGADPNTVVESIFCSSELVEDEEQHMENQVISSLSRLPHMSVEHYVRCVKWILNGGTDTYISKHANNVTNECTKGGLTSLRDTTLGLIGALCSCSQDTCKSLHAASTSTRDAEFNHFVATDYQKLLKKILNDSPNTKASKYRINDHTHLRTDYIDIFLKLIQLSDLQSICVAGRALIDYIKDTPLSLSSLQEDKSLALQLTCAFFEEATQKAIQSRFSNLETSPSAFQDEAFDTLKNLCFVYLNSTKTLMRAAVNSAIGKDEAMHFLTNGTHVLRLLNLLIRSEDIDKFGDTLPRMLLRFWKIHRRFVDKTRGERACEPENLTSFAMELIALTDYFTASMNSDEWCTLFQSRITGKEEFAPSSKYHGLNSNVVQFVLDETTSDMNPNALPTILRETRVLRTVGSVRHYFLQKLQDRIRRIEVETCLETDEKRLLHFQYILDIFRSFLVTLSKPSVQLSQIFTSLLSKVSILLTVETRSQSEILNKTLPIVCEALVRSKLISLSCVTTSLLLRVVAQATRSTCKISLPTKVLHNILVAHGQSISTAAFPFLLLTYRNVLRMSFSCFMAKNENVNATKCSVEKFDETRKVDTSNTTNTTTFLRSLRLVREFIKVDLSLSQSRSLLNTIFDTLGSCTVPINSLCLKEAYLVLRPLLEKHHKSDSEIRRAQITKSDAQSSKDAQRTFCNDNYFIVPKYDITLCSYQSDIVKSIMQFHMQSLGIR